jgi:hypothetical protein
LSIQQNTFNFEGSASYITLRGLEITNGTFEDAIKLADGKISHITLENLNIHDVSIGIRVATDTDHLIIRNNHIHHTDVRDAMNLDKFLIPALVKACTSVVILVIAQLEIRLSKKIGCMIPILLLNKVTELKLNRAATAISCAIMWFITWVVTAVAMVVFWYGVGKMKPTR